MGMTYDEYKHIPDLKMREISIKCELKKYFESNKYDPLNPIYFEYSTTTLLPIFFNFYPKNETMVDFIKLLIETFNHIVIMKFIDFKSYEKKYKNVFEESKNGKINEEHVARRVTNRKLIKVLIESCKNVSRNFWASNTDSKSQHHYITIFISVKEYFEILEYLKSFGFKTIQLHASFFKFLNQFFDKLVPEVLQCEWITIIKRLYNCKCNEGCYFTAITGPVINLSCRAENFKYFKENIFSENEEKSIKIKELNDLSACNCKFKELTDSEDIKIICKRLKKITLRPDFLLNSLLNFNEEIKNIKETLPYSLKLTLSSKQQSIIAEGILKHGCFLYDDLNSPNNSANCYCHTCVNRNSKSLPTPTKLTVTDIKYIDNSGTEVEKQIVFNSDDYSLFNFRDRPQPLMGAKDNLINFLEELQREGYNEQPGSIFYDFSIFDERLVQNMWAYTRGDRSATDHDIYLREILYSHTTPSDSGRNDNSPSYSDLDDNGTDDTNHANDTWRISNIADTNFPHINPPDSSSLSGEIEQPSINLNDSESLNSSFFSDFDSEFEDNLSYQVDIDHIPNYSTVRDVQSFPNDFSSHIYDNIEDRSSDSYSTRNDHSSKIIIKDIQTRIEHITTNPVKDDIKIEISKFDRGGRFTEQFIKEKTNIFEKIQQNEMYIQPTEEELAIDDHLFKTIENQDNIINYQEKSSFRRPIRQRALLEHSSSLYPTFKKQEIYPFRRNHIVIPLAIMYFYKEQWPLLVICKQKEKDEWEKIAIYCLKEWQKIDLAFENEIQEVYGQHGGPEIQELQEIQGIQEETRKMKEEEFKEIQEIFKQISYNSSEGVFKNFFYDFSKSIKENIVIPVSIEQPSQPKYDHELLMNWENNKKTFSIEDTSLCFADTSIKLNNNDKITISLIKGPMLSPFMSATISRFLLTVENSLNETHNLLDFHENFGEEEIKEKLKNFLKEEYIHLDSEKAKRINELKNKYKKLKETIIEPDCLSQKLKIMTTRAFNAEFLKQKKNLIKSPEFDFLNSNYCTILTSDTNSSSHASHFEEIAIRSKRLLLRNSPGKLLPMFHKIDLLLSNFKNYMNFNISLKNIKLSAPSKDFDYLEILKLLFTNHKQCCFLGASLIVDEVFQFYKFNMHEIFYGIIYVLM